jgi:hypothetical protein
MRIILAFQCFFLILFAGRLPAKARLMLPEPEPEPRPLPPPEPRIEKVDKPVKKEKDNTQLHREGALALLSLFQREGRLVDFLREGLDGFDDGAIGAAARDVHRGCKKVLDEHFSFEPMMPGEEEASVTVRR